MLVGGGDIKATDFLTSLRAGAAHLQPLHLGAGAGMGTGRGVWRRGLRPLFS